MLAAGTVSRLHCGFISFFVSHFVPLKLYLVGLCLVLGFFFGFGFFWRGTWGGGAGGRGIAELKVKISQQSFKDMPTQKNGSEEDT